MKRFILIIIVFLFIQNIVLSQSMKSIPPIGSFTWGMSYEDVLRKIKEKGYDYSEQIATDGKEIICDNYHIFLYNVGLSDGYITVFRFNTSQELFGICTFLTKDRFNDLRKKGVIKNLYGFIEVSNAEWLFLRRYYGEEDIKTMPTPNIGRNSNFEQSMMWLFTNGTIEFSREWEGSHSVCKNFVNYIYACCRDYE